MQLFSTKYSKNDLHPNVLPNSSTVPNNKLARCVSKTRKLIFTLTMFRDKTMRCNDQSLSNFNCQEFIIK